MSWEHYHLLFRLESPLHIGWRKVGNLMQTRRYVSGKNLWAALTEALVHRAGCGHDGHAYQAVGEILKRNLRFGYLWPAHGKKNSDASWKIPTAPHFPWEDAQGSEYWDYLYLNGTAHTAQDPGTRTASEGSLHEVEYIAPYTRTDAPVYLVGDVWSRDREQWRDGEQVRTRCAPAKGWLAYVQQNWQAALTRLQIGGERGYGWGRIRLTECRENAPLTWPGWSWQGQEEVVVLHPPEQEGTRLPAHALAVDFQEDFPEDQRAVQGVQGAVEPWIGWERTPRKVRLSQVRILYEPGSRRPHGVARLILHPWGYLYASKADAAEGSSTN